MCFTRTYIKIVAYLPQNFYKSYESKQCPRINLQSGVEISKMLLKKFDINMDADGAASVCLTNL